MKVTYSSLCENYESLTVINLRQQTCLHSLQDCRIAKGILENVHYMT